MPSAVDRPAVSPNQITRPDLARPATNPTQEAAPSGHRPLYTPEEKIRRDESRWTLVQGVLAPLQFLVFLVSLGLVVRYLLLGEGLQWATASVVIKTLVLYLIMVTGCIWEKVVFGVYLFAPAFFWEDAFSMLVLALHTAYLGVLLAGWLTPQQQMLLALAAYAAYVINATQFLLKLRAARLQAQADERTRHPTGVSISASGVSA